MILAGRAQATSAPAIRVRMPDQTIQVVPLEDYLPGVVAKEMDARKFPQAALEAQAIAARSYAWGKSQEARAIHREYDLEASVRDQVYDPKASHDPRAVAAVNATEGMVLVDAKAGKVIAPYYHSTCGGQTEVPAHVWGKGAKHASYRSRACDFCSDSPRAHWESWISEKDLGSRIPDFAGDPVVSWEFTRDKNHGRVSTITATTRGGRRLQNSGQKWRALLGFDVLRSLLLEAPRKERDGWSFRGRGAGHGVGMCQWGARGAALKGWDVRKILSHYYPFAQVRHF